MGSYRDSADIDAYEMESNAPYNYYVTKYRPNGIYTGCVTVAAAQIVTSVFYDYYWKRGYILPEELKSIEGEFINWEAIFRDIDGGRYTYTNANDVSVGALSVAWLMFMIGDSLGVKYNGKEGSFSEIEPTAYFLQNFRFKNLQILNYSTSSVDYMLDTPRLPVYIQGTDVSGRSAHAWVIDGRVKQERKMERGNYDSSSGTLKFNVVETYMEERTLYHCNYGYNGDYDGYYYSQVFNLKEGPVITEDEAHDNGGKGREYNPSRNNRVIICSSFMP